MASLRNKEQIREACLDAARLAIIDFGWRRTTLTEVARRAGVSRMTLYRIWSDMNQLFVDLLAREWADVVRAEAAHGTETRQGLVSVIVAVTRAMRHNELYRRVLELDSQLVMPYVLERRGPAQDRIIAGYVIAIRAGQAAGHIRAGDPATMARALLLAGTGFLLSVPVMADAGVTEEALDAEFALLLDRMLAP